MKKFWADFQKFISRGNVVDMAVGVAVASAFTAIVTAFTKGFISPLLALLSGESHLEEMKWIIREEILDGETVVQAEVSILWGSLLQAVINFLIVALVLFTVMRIASAISARAKKLSTDVKNLISNEDEKAAAEAAAAEAAAKEAAEKEAAAAAEAERLAKEKEQAEISHRENQEALLREIRDLLKNK